MNDSFKKTGQSRLPIPNTKLAGRPSQRMDEHLVSLVAPTLLDAERYRMLRYKLEQMRRTGNHSVMAVTSPVVGDGKTTTAINLAGALAQGSGVKILLVDTDLRKPSVGVKLGMGNSRSPSLVDAIQDPSLPLEAVVQPCPPFNLSVLLAGQPQETSYELLQSPRLEELLQEARKQYNYIVVDTPPLIPVPDCQVIANWVDGFLVVVAAHRTPRKLFEEALDMMDPGKIIGLIFNNDDRPRSGYYAYYYQYVQPT